MWDDIHINAGYHPPPKFKQKPRKTLSKLSKPLDVQSGRT